jgi:hypothetical protein
MTEPCDLLTQLWRTKSGGGGQCVVTASQSSLTQNRKELCNQNVHRSSFTYETTTTP